jgi:hypothetical protein
MKLNKKQASFSIVLVFLVIGFLEITLNLLALVSPGMSQIVSFDIPGYVPDKHLGRRPNPAIPGHDRLGFRNPTVPAKAHIVALGDSQTYGAGVEPEDAWPKQLESMTGKTVYNMAYSAYGPPDSLMLWDEAVAFEPRIVIEAFYAGNDLFDSFNAVYNLGKLPELKSSDPQVQERIREAEQSEPIVKRASQEESNSLLRRLLSQHSRIYGLLRRTKNEFMHLVKITQEEQWETAKAFAEAHPACCQVFSNGQFKTIFTSENRLLALNLEDPRIAEGLQISFRVMQKMNEYAVARNIRLLVVLIPTKETVFRKLWQSPSRSYSTLTEIEERFWRTTKDFFEQNGIEYLDSLSVLQGQFAAGIQPYQVSSDGHPNKQGHRAIAKLVAAYLELPRTSKAQAE